MLKRRELEEAVGSKLSDLASNSYYGEYARSNQVYMDMTIGNAKWHTDQALGEVRHNKGIKIKKIKATEGILLPDTIVKSYVIACKRLVMYQQKISPPEDLSKLMN